MRVRNRAGQERPSRQCGFRYSFARGSAPSAWARGARRRSRHHAVQGRPHPAPTRQSRKFSGTVKKGRPELCRPPSVRVVHGAVKLTEPYGLPNVGRPFTCARWWQIDTAWNLGAQRLRDVTVPHNLRTAVVPSRAHRSGRYGGAESAEPWFPAGLRWMGFRTAAARSWTCGAGTLPLLTRTRKALLRRYARAPTRPPIRTIHVPRIVSRMSAVTTSTCSAVMT